MEKKIIFYLLLLPCFFTYGQNTPPLDSLLRELSTQSEDSNKLNNLIKIQELFTDKQGDKKLAYLEQALQLAQKLKLRSKQVYINLSLGTYYTFRSDFEKSLKYHLECAKVAENIHDTENQIKGYLGIGQAFEHLYKHSPKAKLYYKKAEDLALATKDSSILSNIYLQIAFNHYYVNQFDSTLFYHFKALKLASKKKSLKLTADIYNEIGLTYSKQKKTDLALKNFDIAIDIYKKLPKLPNTELSYVYSDIGFTYSEMKEYQKALKAFKLSLTYAKEAKNTETQMENYQYLADLYGEMKDYKQQANFLKKYYSIKDSLFDNDHKMRVLELENNYQLEKKNAEIARKELQISESDNQRKFWTGVAIFSLLLMGVLGYFYREISKNNIQINQQKEELQQLNHVKDRLFAVLSHDLRNPLITLKTYFSMISLTNLSIEKKEKYTKQTLESVNYTSELMDNLLLWANSQIKNNVVKFSSVNLQDTVENVVDVVNPQAQQKNILIEKHLAIESINSNQQIIETILRNLLTNAIKFSKNGAIVTIKAEERERTNYLEISDNGTGMSQEKIQLILTGEISQSKGTNGEKGSGIGLFLVKELIKQINATLKIESQEGVGSKFIIGF